MLPVDFAATITALQFNRIHAWKTSGVILSEQGFLKLVEENHAFNYQLWHAEDKARRDDLGYEFVYRAKREIDGYNQQRNNKMEAIDTWIVQILKPASYEVCSVHSETPGMIIDRLSILALKSYHMNIQANRTDADPMHQQTCAKKQEILEIQRQQLTDCLDQLIREVKDKTRTFRLYQQLKMYNDPALNPELYQKTTG